MNTSDTSNLNPINKYQSLFCLLPSAPLYSLETPVAENNLSIRLQKAQNGQKKSSFQAYIPLIYRTIQR